MKSGKNYSLPLIILFILLGLSIVVFPASGTIFTTDGTEIDVAGLNSLMDKPASNETPRVLFFYDPECGACQPVHDFIDEFLEENPDTILESVNIAEDAQAMERFNDMKTEFNREKVYIPVIYIGPVAFEGTDDIMTYFKDVYAWYMNSK